MNTDLIEILKYILLAISAILIITLSVSYIVSKFKSETDNEVDAGNLIKSPEPKIVRTSNKKSHSKSHSSSKSREKTERHSSRHSHENRRSSENSGYQKESDKRYTHEEKRKVTRSTGSNTPRMQVLTDLKNPNKKNIQDQYFGNQ